MPEGGEVVRLEHWIYGATPEKGYGTKAVSKELNPTLYEPRLAGKMTPVRVEKTTSGDSVIDSRMIHAVPTTEEVMLSVLGRGPADEYNRPTIANHTVVIPVGLLKSGLVTLLMVEQAAKEFDKKFPAVTGKIEPLDLAPRGEAEISAPAGVPLKKLVSRAAVETLTTRLLADQHGRTLILCRGSSNSARNELLYRLMELLNWECDLPIFTAISDAPTLSAMNHFRVAISARGVRADASWMLLDASIEKAALPNAKGKPKVYERIAHAFER
jgi:hypothetical protein